MRDPLSWSFPLVRLFGIQVRVHILFPVVAAGLILRAAYPKEHVEFPVWIDATVLMGILFLSVFLHEMGHCAGARLVHGDAHEVLLWPLGGLASLDLPHRARAHFVAVAAGPAVNLLLVLTTGVLLATLADVRPPLSDVHSPWQAWYPYRIDAEDAVEIVKWDGSLDKLSNSGHIFLARVFYVNWVLFFFNLLPGFPLDGGRLVQSLLWPWKGFRQATMLAIWCGFTTMLLVGIVAIWVYDPLFMFLALFIYYTCRQQWMFLEQGGEDAIFGYDFSQGYTSLEGEQPPPSRRRRPSFWQRWLQKRNARKLQRAQEQREAEERRMDELLEKIQRIGIEALTDEERRFLERVSGRYRNRQ
jgi:Zn-dependent protease